MTTILGLLCLAAAALYGNAALLRWWPGLERYAWPPSSRYAPGADDGYREPPAPIPTPDPPADPRPTLPPPPPPARAIAVRGPDGAALGQTRASLLPDWAREAITTARTRYAALYPHRPPVEACWDPLNRTVWFSDGSLVTEAEWQDAQTRAVAERVLCQAPVRDQHQAMLMAQPEGIPQADLRLQRDRQHAVVGPARLFLRR